MRTRLLAQEAEPNGQGTAAAFVKEEEAHWHDVIKTANVTLE